MSRIIGIDLGTTNTCVALWEDDGPARTLADQHGAATLPSVVAFLDNEQVVVGHAAARQGTLNPGRTLAGVKRLIGRKVNDETVSWFAQGAAFEIMAAPNGDAWVRIGEHHLSPQEIASHVLSAVRAIVDTHVDEPVTRAVITVPAYFNDSQRQATRDAGVLAGLDVVRIINEPTAAALAYGVHRLKEGRRVIAVFDLGGGTFDISIMAVEDHLFEVLSTNGDMSLGGDDFDSRLSFRLAEELYASEKTDLMTDPVARHRLRESVQMAKHELSSQRSATIHLTHLGQRQDGSPIHLERTITQSEFESLTADLLDRLAWPCEQALADARLRAGDVEEIILVGGMTRVPSVQRKVAEIFGRSPSRGAHPDEIVALGAATHGGILSGDGSDATLVDVLPHTISIKLGGDKLATMVAKNSLLPARTTKLFATRRDNQDFFRVELFQGNSPVIDDNKKLGEIVLSDLPKREAGQVRIEITVTVDVDSIVHLGAKELSSGKSTTVTIEPSSGLNDRELDQAIQRRRRASKAPDLG